MSETYSSQVQVLALITTRNPAANYAMGMAFVFINGKDGDARIVSNFFNLWQCLHVLSIN
jgi:hypothetical protein